jgi:hypothetical protein
MTTAAIDKADTVEARIEVRRAQLQQQLAAIPADDDLPASTTQADLARNRQRRATVEGELAALNRAVAAVTALGSVAFDEQWRDQLTGWRTVLCDERMQIKSPIRDPVVKGREMNLAASIKCIDRGLHAFEHSQWELENSRLGQLMREAGYEPVGADPQRNYGGRLPCHGSLPEVEQRIATLAQKREQAEAALDAALMSDEERAAQEQESQQLAAAFNSMTVKLGPDGGLVALDDDGEVFEVSKITDLQRRAFERMDALHPPRAEQPAPRSG